MKPYNCIRIVADSSLLQRLYIPLVPIDSLDIIRLEKSCNPAVSQFQKILGDQISSPHIIHKDMGLVLHFRINSLNKNIRDLVLVQIFIEIWVTAAKLAFARLDDQSINILLQKLLQTSGFLLTAVSRIFQNNAVSLLGQDIIHSLDQPWENIIGNIGGHYCNISGLLHVPHFF